MLYTTPIGPEAILRIMRQIRDTDMAEYEAVTGKPWSTIGPGLLETLQNPLEVTTAVWTEDDQLVAVGGFNMAGRCWFICTDLVEKHPKGFCRIIKQHRDMVHQNGAVCHNVVGLQNELHVRFLKWLGAEISPKVTHRGGWDFSHFYIPPPIGGNSV